MAQLQPPWRYLHVPCSQWHVLPSELLWILIHLAKPINLTGTIRLELSTAFTFQVMKALQIVCQSRPIPRKKRFYTSTTRNKNNGLEIHVLPVFFTWGPEAQEAGTLAISCSEAMASWGAPGHAECRYSKGPIRYDHRPIDQTNPKKTSIRCIFFVFFFLEVVFHMWRFTVITSNYTEMTTKKIQVREKLAAAARNPLPEPPVPAAVPREARCVAKGGYRAYWPQDFGMENIWEYYKILVFNRNHRKSIIRRIETVDIGLNFVIQVLLKHDALRLAAGPLVSQNAWHRWHSICQT